MQVPLLQDSLQNRKQVRDWKRPSVLAEGAHGLVCLAPKVEIPSFIRLGDSRLSALNGDGVLALDHLAIEDEEWCCVVLLPTVQVGLDVCLDTSQATEGG